MSEHEEIIIKREDSHGPAEKTFKLTATFNADIMKALGPTKVQEPHVVSLFNIMQKIARIICGQYHPDHWDDIIGYALLGKKQHEKSAMEKFGEIPD